MKSQVFIQSTGGKIAIGIKGPKQEREKLYNRIFNFGGTDGRLHEMSENFSYFMAKSQDVLRCLAWGIVQKKQLRGTSQKGYNQTLRNRRRRACESGRHISKNFFENCLDLARKEIATWKPAQFLPELEGSKNFHRILDGGQPEWEVEYER